MTLCWKQSQEKDCQCPSRGNLFYCKKRARCLTCECQSFEQRRLKKEFHEKKKRETYYFSFRHRTVHSTKASVSASTSSTRLLLSFLFLSPSSSNAPSVSVMMFFRTQVLLSRKLIRGVSLFHRQTPPLTSLSIFLCCPLFLCLRKEEVIPSPSSFSLLHSFSLSLTLLDS